MVWLELKAIIMRTDKKDNKLQWYSLVNGMNKYKTTSFYVVINNKIIIIVLLRQLNCSDELFLLQAVVRLTVSPKIQCIFDSKLLNVILGFKISDIQK